MAVTAAVTTFVHTSWSGEHGNLVTEQRTQCHLLEQAAGVLGRSSRLRMAPRDNHGWIPGVAAHTCRTALGGFGAAGQYARRGQV